MPHNSPQNPNGDDRVVGIAQHRDEVGDDVDRQGQVGDQHREANAQTSRQLSIGRESLDKPEYVWQEAECLPQLASARTDGDECQDQDEPADDQCADHAEDEIDHPWHGARVALALLHEGVRTMSVPKLRQVVLDTTDARELAEFYRKLLGLQYRPGHEEDDPAGDFWLVLQDDEGRPRLAFQQVPALAPATWPDGPVPQQLHLDLTVTTTDELDVQHDRAMELGAKLLEDRADDVEEPLRVYADPAGHPFCIFVAT